MTELRTEEEIHLLSREELTGKPMKVVLLRMEDLERIYEKAADIAAKTAINNMEKEKEKAKKQMKDRRLRNTKLLLKNYRMLRANIDYSVYKEVQLEESATDILDTMVNTFQDDVVVDSIRRSAKRTAIMVSHVDKMMGLYKSYCENSTDYLEQRRYGVVFDMYINEERLSADQIAERHSISRESVYADVRAASEMISALIFGIDGLNVW